MKKTVRFVSGLIALLFSVVEVMNLYNKHTVLWTALALAGFACVALSLYYLIEETENGKED